MKFNNILKLIIFLFIIATVGKLKAQDLPVNNRFDVIIKKDGSIVYGLVQEVGLTEIKYKRTDIPDGPIYSILRVEVYAISYRNQIKEILAPVDSTIFAPKPKIDSAVLFPPPIPAPDLDFQNAEIRLKVGAFRGFSKLNNSDDYSSSLGFVPIIIDYDVAFRNKYRVGLSLGFASYNFNRIEFNTYDSTQIGNDVSEKQFVANVYIKRRFDYGNLKPFILGGVGLNSSLLKSSSVVALDIRSNRRLLIESEGRSASLGIQLRAGLDYDLNENFKITGDIGTGLSIVQLGITFKL